jgi:hypothetical protein
MNPYKNKNIFRAIFIVSKKIFQISQKINNNNK